MQLHDVTRSSMAAVTLLALLTERGTLQSACLALLEVCDVLVELLSLVLNTVLVLCVLLVKRFKFGVQLQQKYNMIVTSRVAFSCVVIANLFLGFLQLRLLLLDSNDEHLSHFLFFPLQLAHVLLPLVHVRLLKTKTNNPTLKIHTTTTGVPFHCACAAAAAVGRVLTS